MVKAAAGQMQLRQGWKSPPAASIPATACQSDALAPGPLPQDVRYLEDAAEQGYLSEYGGTQCKRYDHADACEHQKL